MKTNILLASVLLVVTSAQAQTSNVYSQNVVGHINQVFPAGALVCIANPLNNGSNTLDTVLANVPAKSTVQIWNGSGFTASVKGTSWAPNFSVPPGVGFFLNSKSTFTNTYLGAVTAPVGGCASNVFPGGITLVGNLVPYAADLNNSNLNLTFLPAKSSIIQVWNGSGYTPAIKAVTWSPAIFISEAQGFFVTTKSSVTWWQCLNP